MRNGMSVKEIYEELAKVERLQNSCNKAHRTIADLHDNVCEVFNKIDNTIRVYDLCRRDANIDKVMVDEFTNRIKGLLEARQIISDVFIKKED